MHWQVLEDKSIKKSKDNQLSLGGNDKINEKMYLIFYS